MIRLPESCAFLAKKVLPWALALALPIACAGRSDDGDAREGADSAAELENVGEVSQALTNGTVSTEANLKIAFAGDTTDGTSWGSVLTLAKNEGAKAVVTAGDMTYD